MNQRFLIIGANSDIAKACIPLFEARGVSLILAARNPEELPESKHKTIVLDVTQTDDAISKIEGLEFDGLIYAAGILPDNVEALFGVEAENTIQVNYAAAVRLIGHVADRFRAQKSGTIVGISSVAADRGKASNVVYGSAKAGFDHYLSGLRQYLHPSGVRVLTIRPGFVDTKMTAGMHLPKRLTGSKETVARVLVKNSLQGRRNIVYVKPIWRLIMWVLWHIPESLFKKKSL